MSAPVHGLSVVDHTPDMPESNVARHDRVRLVLRTLGDEERRLRRIGLERPLARIHEQRRFWRFVDGVLASSEPDALRLKTAIERWAQ